MPVPTQDIGTCGAHVKASYYPMTGLEPASDPLQLEV